MNENGVAPTGLSAQEIHELRARVAEAEETLQAIRNGDIDALLIAGASGDQLYTLRSADAPYRALVEQMQDGAVTLSTSGIITYCNRSFAALVEAPLQQVIGAPIDQFVDLADRPTVRTLIVNGAGKIRTHLCAGGRSIEVHISVSSASLDDVEHRTLIVTDMSTLTMVQRESRSKDEFLAMLAHELRNPLGAMGGAVQVLGLANLREPRAIRARDVIERQVRHMARLVDDLLDVGRVVTGKIVLNPRRIDLAESVKSVVAILTSNRAVERLIEVEVESVWLDADPVRLEQIVDNLVSNAIKFTPPDKAIRVSVSGEGSEALLRVIDEGIGILPALLPHIFDLFVQADVTIERARGGLGIGLTLVRRLVELHGGTVEASSGGGGQGTTITVRFPAAAPVAEPIVTTGVPEDGAPRVSRRVLLVDDHADNREMYVMVLEADGHHVCEARNGRDAIEVFRRAKPDIALIDIGLPGIDGYEVARRIRSEPEGQHVRLIALTGYGFPEDRERSRTAGFDRHLVKPIAPEELRNALDESLE